MQWVKIQYVMNGICDILNKFHVHSLQGEARVIARLQPDTIDVKARRQQIQKAIEQDSPFYKKKKILNFVSDRAHGKYFNIQITGSLRWVANFVKLHYLLIDDQNHRYLGRWYLHAIDE